MAIEEDERGSYIFNAKDLCLLARLPELKAAGMNSFKIEGRMKSAYYVAVVKPGRVMFEMAGVDEELAREAMRLAGHKLPIKTQLVMREGLEDA